jgi:hypothetical protein
MFFWFFLQGAATVKAKSDYWGEQPTSASGAVYEYWNEMQMNINANGYRLPTEAE